MLLKDFYEALDQELANLIQKYAADPLLQKHKNNPDNQKSYAFLIWFMEFYAKVNVYMPYVTDGKNDHSFDLVFPIPNQLGHTIYYIVQSKWKKTFDAKLSKVNGKDEFLRSLQELDTILRGNIPADANDLVRQNLLDFQQHRRQNGEAKFIYLTLCANDIQKDLQHNIDTFAENNPKVSIEIIDIERLRLDYIDKHFKKIAPPNPLLSNFDPLKETVMLDVVRLRSGDGTFLRVDTPYKAYSLLLRPKTLHTLFKKYNYNLFYSNIRNPLPESNINEDIVKTAVEAPELFYYYNNGLTALATHIPPINNQAENIEIKGFQVINGAQTLYSLYTAYEKHPDKRTEMDNNILVSLRLIESSNRKLSLDITRYTNLQNPINERDFYSNDAVQIRLQKEFYDLGIIYERRRGEFREYPKNLSSTENTYFAASYLAFVLQEPQRVFKNYQQMLTSGKDWQFISANDDPNGQYELIFNKETQAKQMLGAYNLVGVVWIMTDFHDWGANKPSIIEVLPTIFVFYVALSYHVHKKYFKFKYNREFTQAEILERLQKINFETALIFAKLSNITIGFLNMFLDNEEHQYDRLFDDPSYYKIIVHEFEKFDFSLSLQTIDEIKLDQEIQDDLKKAFGNQ